MDGINKDLLEGARDGRAKDVEKCLIKGGTVNCFTPFYPVETPLHLAAKGGHIDTAAVLLLWGADVHIRDAKKLTPLHQAALGGHTNTVSLLISKEADINSQAWGSIPLHLAALGGHTETAAYLIACGSEINTQDHYKQTPLHLAAWGGRKETADLLISNGADLNIQDREGTPLHSALKERHVYMADFLIEMGADMNIKNSEGKTAFELATTGTQAVLQKIMDERKQVLQELRRLGMETAGDFEDVMKEGSYKCFWNRVYLVGPYSVGKSTLAKFLVGEPIPTEWESTDGIWIYMGRAGMEVERKKWKCFPKGNSSKEIISSLLMSVQQEGSTTIHNEAHMSSHKVNPDVPIDALTAIPSVTSTTETDASNQVSSSADLSPVVSEIGADSTKHLIGPPPCLTATTEINTDTPTAVTPQIASRYVTSLKGSNEISKSVPANIFNTKIHDLIIKTVKEGKYKQKIIPIDIWDFGGQKDYYMTHQLFITSRGIYVLIFNGSVDLHKIMTDLSFLPGHFGKPTVAVYLLHWVNSILSYCKRTDDGFPRIIFVATHKDKIPQHKITSHRKKLTDTIYALFKSHAGLKHLEFNPLIFINAKNQNDPEIKIICKRLIERAVEHPRWGEEMPTTWVPLELQLAKKVEEGTNIISQQELEMLNSQNEPIILNRKQLNTFLKVQHSLGKLLYFDEAKLRSFVIINPAYMVEVLRSIVTEKQFWPKEYTSIMNMLQQTGKIACDDIYCLWNQKHFQHILPHKEHMVKMLVHLDVLVKPMTTFQEDTDSLDIHNTNFLVPCMITKPNCTRYLEKFRIPQKSIVMAYTFIEEVIPPALAFRFLGSFVTIWDVKIYKDTSMLFSDLAVVEVDENHSVTVQMKTNRIVVCLIHKNKKEDIVPTLASSIQECLTAAVHRISEFYSTLSGEVHKTESMHTSGNTSMPFNIEFGVFCSNKFLSKKKDSLCFFSHNTLTTHPTWVCPSHKITHDVQSLHLWFSEKIPLERCPDSCTGLGRLELEHSPSYKHLYRVVKQLTTEQCRQLTIFLGLPHHVWSNLQDEFQNVPGHSYNMMFAALVMWKRGNDNPTFMALRDALLQCKENTHLLCKVFRDINPDTHELTKEMLDKTPSYSSLNSLSKHIGTSVVQLGVELGLDITEIEEIQYEYRNKLSDQTKDVLKRWLKQKKEKPTV